MFVFVALYLVCVIFCRLWCQNQCIFWLQWNNSLLRSVFSIEIEFFRFRRYLLNFLLNEIIESRVIVLCKFFFEKKRWKYKKKTRNKIRKKRQKSLEKHYDLNQFRKNREKKLGVYDGWMLRLEILPKNRYWNCDWRGNSIVCGICSIFGLERNILEQKCQRSKDRIFQESSWGYCLDLARCVYFSAFINWIDLINEFLHFHSFQRACQCLLVLWNWESKYKPILYPIKIVFFFLISRAQSHFSQKKSICLIISLIYWLINMLLVAICIYSFLTAPNVDEATKDYFKRQPTIYIGIGKITHFAHATISQF